MRLPEVGEKIGRYLLERSLSRRKESAVFRASDVALGRVVALKVAVPRADEEPTEAHARFEREARVFDSLEHASRVAIYELGTEGGVSFVAMAWIDGETLPALHAWNRALSHRPRRRLFVASALVVAAFSAIFIFLAWSFTRRDRSGVIVVVDAEITPTQMASSEEPAPDAAPASPMPPPSESTIKGAAKRSPDKPATRRCVCAARGALCATLYDVPRCGCWGGPPGRTTAGCPVEHATSSGARFACKQTWVEGGKDGDTCEAFFVSGTVEEKLTGHLRCTLCKEEVVSDSPPAEERSPCKGRSSHDGNLVLAGHWECTMK